MKNLLLGAGGTGGDTGATWDFSSIAYVEASEGLEEDARGIYFKPDGTKFYTTDGIFLVQYSLSTPWSVGSLSLDDVNFIDEYTDNDYEDGKGLVFSPDGTSFYITKPEDDLAVVQANLSSAWDILAGGNGSEVSLPPGSPSDAVGANGLLLKPDGTELWLTKKKYGSNQNKILQMSMSTPFDATTISFVGEYTLSNSVFPTTMSIDPAGVNLYVRNSTGGGSIRTLQKYTLTTPWDLSTISYDTQFNLPGNVSFYDFYIKEDGTKLYAVVSDELREYDLS